MVEKFQQELQDMMKQLNAEKEITVQLKALQERLDETEGHLSTSIKRRDDLSEKLDELQSVNAALKTDVAESKIEQSALLTRVNKLLERLDEKDNVLSQVQDEKSALVERFSETQGLYKQLQGMYGKCLYICVVIPPHAMYVYLLNTNLRH